MQYFRMINHKLSWWMESNAFSKSMKFTYKLACYSLTCSTIFLNMKIWPVVPLPFLYPPCSFLSLMSIPFRMRSIMILASILPTTESRVIPLQFLHSLRFPLFGNLIISPFFHLPGIFSCLHTFPIISCTFSAENSVFAFSNSAVIESIPGDFLFFNLSIAVFTSPSVGSMTAISFCYSGLSVPSRMA